jgi:hypothetical protein
MTLISIVVGIAVIAAVGRIISSKFDGQPLSSLISNDDGHLLRFIASFIPVGLFGLLNMAAGDLPQVARYIAVMIALGTPIAAGKLILWPVRWDFKKGKKVLVIIIILGTVVSIPTIFASPYLFTPTHHVTEAQVEGYEFIFENSEATNQRLVAIDTEVVRHYRAIYGNEKYLSILDSNLVSNPYRSKRGENIISSHFNNHRIGETEEFEYLMSTSYAREQQVYLYNGFRFSKSDFNYLRSNSRISTIYDNGDARLYST